MRFLERHWWVIVAVMVLYVYASIRSGENAISSGLGSITKNIPSADMSDSSDSPDDSGGAIEGLTWLGGVL